MGCQIFFWAQSADNRNSHKYEEIKQKWPACLSLESSGFKGASLSNSYRNSKKQGFNWNYNQPQRDSGAPLKYMHAWAIWPRCIFLPIVKWDVLDQKLNYPRWQIWNISLQADVCLSKEVYFTQVQGRWAHQRRICLLGSMCCKIFRNSWKNWKETNCNVSSRWTTYGPNAVALKNNIYKSLSKAHKFCFIWHLCHKVTLGLLFKNP